MKVEIKKKPIGFLFLAGSFALLGLVTIYKIYDLKAAGKFKFDLVEGHAPQAIENGTKNIIRCEWFANPHHCD